jgi:NADH-quinone oxidoreductase subunit F
MATNAYVPHAPGYVDNDGPKIVTTRFADPESHTLERFEATGGYEGLRRALDLAPAEVAA